MKDSLGGGLFGDSLYCCHFGGGVLVINPPNLNGFGRNVEYKREQTTVRYDTKIWGNRQMALKVVKNVFFSCATLSFGYLSCTNFNRF